jgi:hypothetical protein
MRFVLLAIQIAVLTLPARAADPLSRYLPDSALQALRAGSVTSMSLPADGAITLGPAVASRDALANEIRNARPTVGVEVLQILANVGSQVDAAKAMLAVYNVAHSVSTMKGMKYYSVTRGKEEVLFIQSYAISGTMRSAQIPDPVYSAIPREDDLFTFQEDNSFGKNTYREHFSFRDDHILVRMENLSAITFMLVPVVQPHNLVSQIILVPSGRDLLFYGVAYLRTGMPIGNHHDKEESLKNRLISLASWLRSRLLDDAKISR